MIVRESIPKEVQGINRRPASILAQPTKTQPMILGKCHPFASGAMFEPNRTVLKYSDVFFVRIINKLHASGMGSNFEGNGKTKGPPIAFEPGNES